MVRWKITKIWVGDNSLMPELDPGWEPFGITRMATGWYIWLRKKVKG